MKQGEGGRRERNKQREEPKYNFKRGGRQDGMETNKTIYPHTQSVSFPDSAVGSFSPSTKPRTT